MNVPRDFESLFNSAVNSITVLIDWAPTEMAKDQLGSALSILNTGYNLAKRGFVEISAEPRRECSGPLPGGKDITVVQTGEKTLFVRPPRPAVNLWPADPPESTPRSEAEGVYVEPEEKVPEKLDFLGTWKTRGGFTVEVEKFEGGKWWGFWRGSSGVLTTTGWDAEGKVREDPRMDLMDRHREGKGFANA